METVNFNYPSSLIEAIRTFSVPQICLEVVARAKWGKSGPTCPRCESKRHSFLKTRLMWKCLDCRKQFSVKVGTIFEDSPIGLDKWLCALWLLVNCKNGVSSYEVSRDLGISQKSAWFVLQRLRHILKDTTVTPMTGPVEVDESFHGGAPKNM